ncbi:MAG: LysR family transcriptional regulator [Fusicatenibacter saccharivorans]
MSRAAEVLHITQPTLSRQLSQMEEELGVILFERGTRRIRLDRCGGPAAPQGRRNYRAD